MRFDIVTIFPRMVEAALVDGVVGRARTAGRLVVAPWDLRAFTPDRHRVVDDAPFGGGPGMVLKPEPFVRAVEQIASEQGQPDAVVLVGPQGRRFDHREAVRLSQLAHVAILCGRYEGVDDRVREHVATEEISIGDYVLSGGELAALVIVDAVARLLPGVVGDGESVARDSFADGLLDHPHFTRPADLRGWRVPDVLLSGDHAAVARWRRREALRVTFERRPDLIDRVELDRDQRRWLDELASACEHRD